MNAANQEPSSPSNFHLAFYVLPKPKRKALFDFYHFCRIADDLVDDPGPSPQEAKRSLDDLRQEVRESFSGSPKTSLGQDIKDLRLHFPVREENFLEILDGCEMDLFRSRYDTFEDLRQYCYRVASAVGLVCIEIFGYDHASAHDYAIRLGMAFQLTNILRDLKEDTKRGRIYLPKEDLKRFDYSEEMLLRREENVAFRALMDFECARALTFYREAQQHLHPADRRKMRSAQIMRAIYFEILKKIQEDPGSVFRKKIRLSKVQKLYLAAFAWLAN